MQRFTAAHELGHLEMGHDFSLDSEEQILRPRGASPKMLQEVAANAFGAEFLMPKSLLRRIMERYRWNAGDLGDPRAVYQLSLRVGVSYQAMCVSLIRHKWIDQQTLDRLMKTSPKTIKAHLLDGVVLEDPWADVWSLSEADHDGEIEAGPNDIFLLKLREHGGSGYLWNADDLVRLGFIVERHEGPLAVETVGSALTRCWKISADFPSEGYLNLEERRPWQADDVIGQFNLAYSLWGKEAGIPRFQRPLLRAA
ncbi:ImmA/IrrE family metallo-endopeptidase [Magnetospirillum sp. J10]|uniref:ImmA/IrrE family metallo-endopeptidase n=1 Tax=Magnetospirillum sulfuroxidans TaxID=611300 RepID=A0ABS5IHA4_9PROT|nr:ImmA/IrrE family metallo-endopeptidase [Magnetospirillum sulfuroxidans]